jgi:hypothetical protein
MNRQVNVTSIDALRRFQAALREYSEAVQDVLANLQLEAQRTVDWVQQDRMAYWPHQVRLAGEALTEALNQLEMKQLTLDGRDAPSCSEEKNAVHRSRQRLRYTEQQLARTRQLGPIVQHQAEEYQGVLAKLAQMIETDIPRALAALDRMASSLEKYASVAPPAAAGGRRPETPP